jgi:hypothetical protein
MMYYNHQRSGSASLSVVLVIVLFTTLMAHALYVTSLSSDSAAQRMIAEQKRASMHTGLELLIRWASRQYNDLKNQPREELIFSSWPLGNGRTVPLTMRIESCQEGLLLAVSLSEKSRPLRLTCLLTEHVKTDAQGRRVASYEITGWQETSVL